MPGPDPDPPPGVPAVASTEEAVRVWCVAKLPGCA